MGRWVGRWAGAPVSVIAQSQLPGRLLLRWPPLEKQHGGTAQPFSLLRYKLLLALLFSPLPLTPDTDFH